MAAFGVPFGPLMSMVMPPVPPAPGRRAARRRSGVGTIGVGTACAALALSRTMATATNATRTPARREARESPGARRHFLGRTAELA